MSCLNTVTSNTGSVLFLCVWSSQHLFLEDICDTKFIISVTAEMVHSSLGVAHLNCFEGRAVVICILLSSQRQEDTSKDNSCSWADKNLHRKTYKGKGPDGWIQAYWGFQESIARRLYNSEQQKTLYWNLQLLVSFLSYKGSLNWRKHGIKLSELLRGLLKGGKWSFSFVLLLLETDIAEHIMFVNWLTSSAMDEINDTEQHGFLRAP